jgi:GNAT superfamily N-acetyltransferase
MEDEENLQTSRFPRTVTVNGRRVCIRPITPDDRERIVHGLRSMSVETSYRRFFTPTFYPSEKTLQYLTHIDGEQHMALGAVDCSREGNPGMGAARYVRLSKKPSIAEAAVVVIDEYQQQGIGSMLIAALSRYAADHGVAAFRGFVLAENRDFLDYLRTLGAFDEHAREGIIQLDVPVYAREEDLPTDPDLQRARWAWKTVENARLEDCDGSTVR